MANCPLAKPIDRGVSNTYQGRTSSRDEVTCDITVFGTSESIETGVPTSFLTDVRVVHGMLTSTLERLVGSAMVGIIRKVPTKFAADMSPFTASARLASMASGDTTDEIEAGMSHGGERRRRYLGALADSRITFSFGSPITWRSVDEEMEAYVELWDAYPQVLVLDNLMDFDGAESDYAEQMAVMARVAELARATESTVLVLHHASDKSWEAKSDPWAPPSRDQVKGGLSEKPELSLSVALDPNTRDFRVAIIKQRMGPSDPTARTFTVLRCDPERTRFHRLPFVRASHPI